MKHFNQKVKLLKNITADTNVVFKNTGHNVTQLKEGFNKVQCQKLLINLTKK